MGTSFVLLDVFLTALFGYLFVKNMWDSISKYSILCFYFFEVAVIDSYEITVTTLSILFF